MSDIDKFGGFEFGVSTNAELDLLNQRIEILEANISKVKAGIKKAPNGRLHIAKRGKYKAYYVRTDSKDPTGEYISKKNRELAQHLAQREYMELLLKKLIKEKDTTQALITDLLVYTALHLEMDETKYDLIQPIIPDDSEYISRWEEVEYTGKEIEDDTEFYTLKGERVRSKSEVMIANCLYNKGIPYRYEYPITLDGRKVYPDFYCLNIRTKEEIVYEHFGMMGNIEYVENMLFKMRKYEKAGFYAGKNLIYTMESSDLPLSTKNIENVIDIYLS